MTVKVPQGNPAAANAASIVVRQRRAALKKAIADGSVSPVSALRTAPGSDYAGIRVNEFLRSIPGVGPKRAQQIMERLHISNTKRIGGLGPKQHEILARHLARLDDHGSNRLVVLAGPTAVGKGTVAEFIRARHPEVMLSISATTRKPRPTEIEGQNYYFVDDAKFDQMIRDGEFLEYAKVHNAYRYGTPKTPVVEALNQGKKVLLEIDLQGARAVKQAYPDAYLVFLAPPSWEELVKRLTGRATETPEEQARRLETARDELASQSEFDAVVINDSVARAAEEVVNLMGAA